MNKKKLSSYELGLKKMAVLINRKFISKKELCGTLASEEDTKALWDDYDPFAESIK